MEIAVRHSANAGDIIYSLWATKKLAEITNEQVTFYQRLDVPAFYYEGAIHPTRSRKGIQVTMNESMFEMMYPLVKSCDFIKDFKIWGGERAMNFDRIREIKMNQAFTDIRMWYGMVFPELTCDISSRVLSVGVKVPLDVSDAIIVNKTARYGNPNISYDFLNKVKREIYFAGALEEYSDFQTKIVKAKYLPVKNFYELAIYIQNCKMFIGSQSMCFAIAEGLKKQNRLLEICPNVPNVVPVGPKAYSIYLQQSFEDTVNSIR